MVNLTGEDGRKSREITERVRGLGLEKGSVERRGISCASESLYLTDHGAVPPWFEVYWTL